QRGQIVDRVVMRHHQQRTAAARQQARVLLHVREGGLLVPADVDQDHQREAVRGAGRECGWILSPRYFITTPAERAHDRASRALHMLVETARGVDTVPTRRARPPVSSTPACTNATAPTCAASSARLTSPTCTPPMARSVAPRPRCRGGWCATTTCGPGSVTN